MIIPPPSQFVVQFFSGGSGDEASGDETEEDAVDEANSKGDPVVEFLLEQGAEIDRMVTFSLSFVLFNCLKMFKLFHNILHFFYVVSMHLMLTWGLFYLDN